MYDIKLKLTLYIYYIKKNLIYWISKSPLTFHCFEILLNLKELCSQTKSELNKTLLKENHGPDTN